MELIVSTLELVGETLWFYLPALIANLLIYVVWVAQGKKADIPLDLHASIRGHRLIGPSRSIAGFFIMVSGALLVGVLQGRAVEGLYLGAGAFVFCALFSLIKRSLHIPRGKQFFGDHIDFYLGASVFYVSYELFPLSIFITGLVLCYGIHLVTNITLRKRFEGLRLS